jgi:Holliday junction DNA helicase RuvB
MEKERFISSTLNAQDERLDNTLRPQSFDDFPGQERKKEQLRIFVQAAISRNDALDHLLLSGPPGLGKTTLANIIANERGTNIKSSSGPVIDKPGDLAGLLTGLEEGDILFIDEIHRLNTTVEEYLYSAMEDFFIDIVIDQGAGSRSIRLDVPPFTLIGATTRQGLLSAPLRTRFGLQIRLDYYPADILQTIVDRSAGILEVPIDTEGAAEIARRSRGTPRVANNLLRRVRDFAQVKADGHIVREVAQDGLSMLEIDQDGLDEMDNRILETILFKFDGGPVGIQNLAVSIGEEADTLQEVYEPFLIQEGFLVRTPQGRIVTARAAQRFGVNLSTRMPAGDPGLFDQG